MFKGKEKSREEGLAVAKRELLTKFKWFDPLSFGNTQFMICYAAAGSKIGFFVLDGSVPPCVLMELTPIFDISAPLGRIKVINTIVNIARILLSIEPNLPQTPIPLGIRLESGTAH